MSGADTAAGAPLYPGMVKVELRADEFVETLWAEETGTPGQFRLDNNPFFAYRVSADDIVEAEEIAPGFYRFLRVIRPSGNRTVRIAFEEFDAEDSQAQPILDGVRSLGCDFEGAYGRMVSVNVPPKVDLAAVATFLTGCGIRWEYANPKYEDLRPAE